MQGVGHVQRRSGACRLQTYRRPVPASELKELSAGRGSLTSRRVFTASVLPGALRGKDTILWANPTPVRDIAKPVRCLRVNCNPFSSSTLRVLAVPYVYRVVHVLVRPMHLPSFRRIEYQTASALRMQAAWNGSASRLTYPIYSSSSFEQPEAAAYNRKLAASMSCHTTLLFHQQPG